MPKDEGRDFEPRTLRIFEAGHRGEDIVAGWLRLAGFDLRTERSRRPAVRLRGAGRPVQGPHRRLPRRRARSPLEYPAALGEQGARRVILEGRGQARARLSKPVYAAQIALYQAYLELPNPALFTALNRDTMELYSELIPFDPSLAQTMSDRAVEVVRACDAEELLPRVAQERTSVLCRGGMSAGHGTGACAWQDRCWGAAA